MSTYIKWFDQVRAKDVAKVGGKNASLGEMTYKLTKSGIAIPPGFAVTAEAFRLFLREGKIAKEVWSRVEAIDVSQTAELARAGQAIRELILATPLPAQLEAEIDAAYDSLCKKLRMTNVDVAARSSATAEDLPKASFAGQHDSYLNVRGKKQVREAVLRCFSSLFTNRAISYRVNHKFKHRQVAMSVGIQLMVRSDRSAAGVMFTIDTESGFPDVIGIDSAWGYGESVVQGAVVPDTYMVFKKTLAKHEPIVSKKLGNKKTKMVASARGGSKRVPTSAKERASFAISDQEVLQLARWGMMIEKIYGRPMDIEWAKDARNKKFYIVQARPETVEAQKAEDRLEIYEIKGRGKVVTEGIAVGSKIGSGQAHVIASPAEISKFKEGEVLVTTITDPAWEPIMQKAAAIVTERGGRTSHAAIVSRELGVPAIVGSTGATRKIKNGTKVTVSCAEGEVGKVYQGIIDYKLRHLDLSKYKAPPVKIMMNVGQPDMVLNLAAIPNDGVGLAREEFIIANAIGVHPLALLNPGKLKNQKTAAKIKKMTAGYAKSSEFFVDKLARGIAMIGAAFYPNDVIVRFSDFKSNEYATLLGGAEFEPQEENPMIGWRGASRYYDKEFEPAFLLECEAFRRVRDEMGLVNVVPMVPFCRTPEEGKKVLATMKKGGLKQGKNGLKVYVMIEVPSNVILADKFAEVFDGFSIGSNDLTQLTLGIDRDTTRLHGLADERNDAVVKLVQQVIKVAKKHRIKIGICGQAPSDYPEFAKMLVEAKIDSISLNPDSILSTRLALAKTKPVQGHVKK